MHLANERMRKTPIPMEPFFKRKDRINKHHDIIKIVIYSQRSPHTQRFNTRNKQT